MPGQVPLVSIAMPFYNCVDTLPAAVRSIQGQTYTNWELLLCDDGSSDGGAAWAASLGDSRIVVTSDGQRKALAARLNECIDRARGEYIARMDGDDITYPDRIQKQVRFLEEHREIDLVGTQMLIFGDDGMALGKRRLPCDHDSIVARPAVSFGLGHPTWLGRAAWFRRYRYSPAAVRYEDVELLYRAYRQSRFANLPDILHGYREPPDGLRKRLTTRMERVRYLWRTRNRSALEATFVEPLKGACDALLVSAGLRYAMLRNREQLLTTGEEQQWQDLLQKCRANRAACR